MDFSRLIKAFDRRNRLTNVETEEDAGKCDDHTELKLEDRVREDTKQGKYKEELIKIEDNPIESPQSQEDLSNSVTDSEDADSTSDRQLRNRSLMQKPKRQAVGARMYLMIKTKSDLAYSVGFLSKSLEKPSAEDIVRVRIFLYIAGSVGYGITYHGTETKGFQECNEDVETWMACDAEDCGFQMLSDDDIVTSVQEESDPVDDETGEDEDNNNENNKAQSNADVFFALETDTEWYEQQSACCPTVAQENQRHCSEKTQGVQW
ncbi:hypothetical protein TNCV_1034731 [Trichonephila clavipes]|nr:hypothetical protein TNCV_1034731 [Trichonephila clavipes]